MRRHRNAVFIHGYGVRRRYSRGTICVGGKNAEQVAAFIAHIEKHKDLFTVYDLVAVDATGVASEETCSGLSGISPRNIVNQTAREMGLQLELSKGMRYDLGRDRYPSLEDIVYGAMAQALQVST